MPSQTLAPFPPELLAAKKQIREHLRNHEKVLTSRVNSKDDIYDSIKTFFGKGH